MKKAIYITLQSLWPDINGGKKISLGRVLKLQETYDKVACVVYNYANEDTKLLLTFLNDQNIELQEFTPIKNMLPLYKRVWHYFISLLNGTSEATYYIAKDHFFCNEVNNMVSSLGKVDVYLDSIFLFPLVKYLNNNNCNIIFHNVESDFYSELSKCSPSFIKKIFYMSESIKIKKLEREIFNPLNDSKNIDLTFLSENDLSTYRQKYENIVTKMNVNHNFIRCAFKLERKVSSELLFILFPGGMSFPPNNEGIKLFLDAYDAELEKKNIKLIITGSVNEVIRKSFFKYKSVQFSGLLSSEDLMELYASCLLVISPIFSGGGVKIKNIETISYGVPLVATKFSCVGINVDSGLVYVTNNSIDDFCNVLSSVLNQDIN